MYHVQAWIGTIMRFVIQRVKEANVKIDEKVIGEIKTGFLILIGVAENDTEEIADKMVRKTSNMRIFADKNGKTNLGLNDIDGELLLVSQFTLYADCKRGNRPGFTEAGNPEKAERMYEYIVAEFAKRFNKVETGQFGADMQVSLTNDGPFTIILDSETL